MHILALDVATMTGCCDGPVGGKPRLWSWSLGEIGKERPARLEYLHRMLYRYFTHEPCDGVVYEAPMPIGMVGEHGRSRIMVSEANVAFLRGAIGVVEMSCSLMHKPVQAVSPQDARASVLGWRTNRGGKNTKRRVLEEVRALGVLGQNDDEADAYVVWAYACALQNPRLAVAYTPLFRGQQ